MFKKFSIVFLIFIGINSCFSQNNINNYKYVIVPTFFDFLSEPDEYQLNSLSEFLFNKYGFVALMDDEALPQELINNGCLVLYAEVIKFPGLFNTKIQIELKNCRKEIIFTSRIGESREKMYKVAYNKALRQAFDSFKILNYKYQPIQEAIVNTTKDNMTVALPVVTVAAADTILDSKSIQPEDVIETEVTDLNILYAQKTSNGYQLVDNTPQVVYVLVFSGKKDFYMVKGKDATVYKIDDKWVIAETVGDDLVVKTLNIKF